MPFKKAGSRYWKIRRKSLPGYGDSGTLSTKVTNRRAAFEMEKLLDHIAEKGLIEPRYHLLLDALKPQGRGRSGQITLPDLLKAKHEGRLEELTFTLQDPTLQEAFAAYERIYTSRNARADLSTTRRYIPKEARHLTYLRDPRHIMQILAAAEADGLKRNSVHKTVYLTISKLLRLHLGSAERDRIFADVRFSVEDDTRDVFLAPDELARLLDGCRAVEARLEQARAAGFEAYVMLAVLTGADRAPLLRLRARDVEMIAGHRGVLAASVHLKDTKTKARPRSVAIADAACRKLLPLLEGKQSTDLVFTPDGKAPISRNQHHLWFKEAREQAKLPHVRFKDLRAQFAIYAERAGFSTAKLQAAMGHATPHMQQRYKSYTAQIDASDAAAVERQMGLHGPAKLKIVNSG